VNTSTEAAAEADAERIAIEATLQQFLEKIQTDALRFHRTEFVGWFRHNGDGPIEFQRKLVDPLPKIIENTSIFSEHGIHVLVFRDAVPEEAPAALRGAKEVCFGVYSRHRDVCVEVTVSELIDWFIPADAQKKAIRHGRENIEKMIKRLEVLTH